MEKYLKKILVNNDLSSRKKVIEFIKENPENLSIHRSNAIRIHNRRLNYE